MTDSTRADGRGFGVRLFERQEYMVTTSRHGRRQLTRSEQMVAIRTADNALVQHLNATLGLVYALSSDDKTFSIRPD